MRNIFIKKYHPRIFLSGMTFALVLFFPHAMASDLSPWADANIKYQSGDFKGALASYEHELQSGKKTAALYYNLGNAHFRLGHKGQALAFYERALRISPRNEDIRWNIALVKSTVTDRMDATDQNLTRVLIGNVTDRLTINELSIYLTALLGLHLFLSLVGFVWPMFRPAVRGIGSIVVAAFLAIALLFGFKWFDVKEAHLVVLDKEIEARYGPSSKETKAFTLHEGAEAKIIDESKDWYYVTLDNKSSGWIPKQSCEVI